MGQLIAQFIEWVIGRPDAGHWTYAGRAKVFFDDTQIELYGPSFESAKINYTGELALCWQTFWLGPFLLAVARWKKAGDLFWRHRIVPNWERRANAGAVLARRRLKGEQGSRKSCVERTCIIRLARATWPTGGSTR